MERKQESGRLGAAWPTVCLFVSSTFHDMHAERDYLVKQVFPSLREWCERRRLRFVDVDLRWGITAADATGRSVLRKLLEHIDRCRPFFLGFLGQRYGWVPRAADVSSETFSAYPGLRRAIEKGRSVTELEVRHAVLGPFFDQRIRRAPEPAEHAFFYLRDEDYLADLAGADPFLQRVYSDEFEPNLALRRSFRARQEALKQLLARRQYPTRSYRARWRWRGRTPELAIPLSCRGATASSVERWRADWKSRAGLDVPGLAVDGDPARAAVARAFNQKVTRGRLGEFECQGKPLGDVILHDLQGAIAEAFPDCRDGGVETPLRSELNQQSSFLESVGEEFIERPGDFDGLDSYVRGEDRALFVLTGRAGSGKSTLLARWIRRQVARPPEPGASVHFRFIGQSHGSTTVDGLLRSILSELRDVGKLSFDLPEDPNDLRESWPSWLGEAGSRGPILLALDALDQLETGLSDLDWLPAVLPPGVKSVVSFREDSSAGRELVRRLARDPAVTLSRVRPFDRKDDRRSLVRAFLGQYLKELDDGLVEALLSSPGAENPLYLKVVLSELRVFGAFDQLGERIEKSFGGTPLRAFHAVLRRLESDPAESPIDHRRGVALVFGLMAYARRGVSTDELVQILHVALRADHDRRHTREWIELLLRQVAPFIARREGRQDFFYELFATAARQRYTATRSSTGRLRRRPERWHRLLAEFFDRLPLRSPAAPALARRKVAELPYHLTHARLWRRAEPILCDLAFVEAKAREGMVAELQTDYDALLERLPQAQRAARIERRWRDRLARYGQELAAFCRGRVRKKPSIPAVSVIAKHPPLDPGGPQARLSDFRRFVRARAHALSQHAAVAGFCLQEALAFADSGPVAEAARRLRDGPEGRHPMLERALRLRLQAPRLMPLRTLRGHLTSVGAARISADGTKAVSGGRDGTLRLWSLVTGRSLASLHHQPGIVDALAINPDATLAVCGGGRILRDEETRDSSTYALEVWDLGSHRRLRTLCGHTDRIADLDLTPDGRVALSASWDGTARAWNVETGGCVGLFRAPAGEVHGARMSADGRLAALCGGTYFSKARDGWLTLWDLRGRKPPTPLPVRGGAVSGLCLGPHARLVVCWEGRRLSAWDVRRRRLLWSREGHGQAIQAAQLSADGRLLVSASRDETVRIWDARSGRVLKVIPVGATPILSLSVTPDARLAVTADMDSQVRLWDLSRVKSGSASGLPPARGHVLVLSRDGRRAITGADDGELAVWDAHSGARLRVVARHDTPIQALALAPSGTLAAATCSDEPIRLWDVRTGRLRGLLEGHRDHVNCFAFAPDGRCVVSGGGSIFRKVDDKVYPDDNLVRVWDPRSATCIHSLEGHTAQVSDVSIGSDGSMAATASWDRTIRLWDIRRGRSLGILTGHADHVLRAVLLPDNAGLLSAAGDRSLRLWNLASRRCLRVLPMGSDILDLDVSAEGDTALVSTGNELAIWDLATGGRRRTLGGHTDEAGVVRLSSDLAVALSGHRDGTIRIWSLADGALSAATVLESGISAASPLRHDGRFGVTTYRGEVVFMRMAGLPPSTPTVTAVRLWRNGTEGGRWARAESVVCPWCGNRGAVPARVVTLIRSLMAACGGPEVPSLEMPGEVRHEPGLVSTCPRCGCRLRYSPFVVDAILDAPRRRKRLRP